ncbi:MAG: polysaccharide deacetylase family protein [bacterium]|nr:polysaccharide deacetylase family protein [bacterium]
MSIFSAKETTNEPKTSRLPLWLLLTATLVVQGDTRGKIDKWVRNCEIQDIISLVHKELPLEGFQANPSEAIDQTSWPEALDNPLSQLRPTFDDGPHPNDLKTAKVLQKFPFNTPIFYYNGINFFSAEALEELNIKDRLNPDSDWKISPGEWISWAERGAGLNMWQRSTDPTYEKKLAEFIKSKLNPEMLKIAKEIHDAGFTIGFHGMAHAPVESPFHMQNLSRSDFNDELSMFERMISIAIDEEYDIQHVRPPYGAGTNDLWSPPFVELCEDEGIEVRNWSFSSFDWEEGSRRGEKLLVDALRVIAAGKTPDILFHSQHQDGTTLGNFGKMLAAWTGHVMSLSTHERRKEIANYKNILENILAETPEDTNAKLKSSKFEVGSPEQIATDSAYNVELEPQYMGAIQTHLSQNADGYIGHSSVNQVKELAQENSETDLTVARTLQDPKTFAKSSIKEILEEKPDAPDLDSYPSPEELMSSGIKFANRGLQIKSIAIDILCRLKEGEFDEDFLNRYRWQGFYIEPSNIPTYVKMYHFLRKMDLDDHTTARILATALIESGVKNDWDRIGLGKQTAEWAGEKMHRIFGETETIPGLIRDLGMKKQGNVMQYGLGSLGPGQVPLPITWAMFELILERNLEREEMEKILQSPEGTALGIYLYLRQYEVRLGSTTW